MAALGKKLITPKEWEKKLDDVKIRKEDMNKLVMNFFVVEGFIEAAKKFGEESGTQCMDLAAITITNRVAVTKAVYCGDIEDAIEKLNDLYPGLLHTNTQLFYQLEQQRFLELIRHDKVGEAMEFAEEVLALWGVVNDCLLPDLERTFYLLAFEDVSNCPQAELLDMSLRLKRAREVNAAILTSHGDEKDPILQSLAKMLTWIQIKLQTKADYPRPYTLGLPVGVWTRHLRELV